MLQFCVASCKMTNKKKNLFDWKENMDGLRCFLTDPLNHWSLGGSPAGFFSNNFVKHWRMPDESTAAVWLTMILQSRVLDIRKTDVFYVYIYIYQEIDSSHLSVSCWSCPEAKHLICQMLPYISCEQRTAEKMFIDPESPDQTKVRKWSTSPSAWITVDLVPQSRCN